MLISCSAEGPSPLSDRETTALEVGSVALVVAVADTSGERSQGLMDVEDLGDLDGMIFVYERPQLVNFTMRNTLLPLDVWFIDANGVIVGTAEMEPCSAEPCVRYGSPAPVLRVLETLQGDYEFVLGSVVANVGSD